MNELLGGVGRFLYLEENKHVFCFIFPLWIMFFFCHWSVIKFGFQLATEILNLQNHGNFKKCIPNILFAAESGSIFLINFPSKRKENRAL